MKIKLLFPPHLAQVEDEAVRLVHGRRSEVHLAHLDVPLPLDLEQPLLHRIGIHVHETGLDSAGEVLHTCKQRKKSKDSRITS